MEQQEHGQPTALELAKMEQQSIQPTLIDVSSAKMDTKQVLAAGSYSKKACNNMESWNFLPRTQLNRHTKINVGQSANLLGYHFT